MAIALAGSVGFALAYGMRDVGAAAQNAPAPHATARSLDMEQADFGEPGSGGGAPGPVDPNAQLPPNHPSINGAAVGTAMGALQPSNDPPALAWTAPAAWKSVPNPNPMRLATYKIEGDTELVVARAGGDVATNVARWSSQFDGSPAPKQTQKAVRDFKVTIVHLEGTFEGGMGTAAGSHPNWAMLGAVVETAAGAAAGGESYFFKVIGPAATVKSAEKPFQAMIDGIKPS